MIILNLGVIKLLIFSTSYGILLLVNKLTKGEQMFSPTKLKEKEKVKDYHNLNLHPVWESVELHTLIGNQVKQSLIKTI